MNTSNIVVSIETRSTFCASIISKGNPFSIAMKYARIAAYIAARTAIPSTTKNRWCSSGSVHHFFSFISFS